MVPIAGAVLVAALAVANPFGDDDIELKVPAQENFDLLDAGDANAFARALGGSVCDRVSASRWAAER